MGVVKLTVLGAGSVQKAPAIVGSLANYFGERPLRITFYDADEERVDLFDRLARLCFVSTYSSHELSTTTDPREALEEADLIVLALDANCARRYLKSERPSGFAALDDLSLIEQAVTDLLGGVPASIPVLSLLNAEINVPRGTYHRLAWPPPMDEATERATPMQIIRWLRKEDMLYDLLSSNDHTPLQAWLNDPMSAELVLGTPA